MEEQPLGRDRPLEREAGEAPRKAGERLRDWAANSKQIKTEKKANGLTLVRGHFSKSSQVIVPKHHFFSVQDTPEM